MLRKRAVALAISLLTSPVVLALGLGALKTESPLNQPFNGRIEILGATVTDFDAMTVKLADAQQFERAGVPRDAVLLNLRFEIVSDETGPDFIRVSSRDPIREPFLNFLLELNWANGRLVREYTVLLDPPLYDRNRQVRRSVPAIPERAPAAPPVAAAAAPAAPPAPARARAAPYATGDGSITVQEADTLWSLASRHRPDASVSVQRMIVALHRANPEAFINGNMNLLRRGAVLRLPDAAELAAEDQASAIAEVRRQHQLWEEQRHAAAERPAPAPVDEEGAAAAPAPAAPAASPEPDADSRLELVTPEAEDEFDIDADTAPGTASEGPAGEALAEEARTTTEQENAELRAKLTEADQIIDLLQRQVEVKDEELAALQQRLASDQDVAAPEQHLPSTWVPPEDTGEPIPPLPAPLGETPATEPAASPDSAGELAEAEEPVPAPPAGAPATVAEAPAATPEPAAPAGTASPPAAAEDAAPAAEPGFLARLIPAHLQRQVPGGALTIVGVLATLLLLLLVALGRAFGRGRERPIGPAKTARPPATPAAAAPAVAAPAVAPATVVDEEAEADEADQFQRTLEASAEQLAARDLPEEDPLEEVNVYLAYERFDQAEELVRKVIEQYPEEHKYKLRLLEIYYSANDKRAYEDAARELHDAVGEQHPLWESAVAMWNEMSPERALFAPGAPAEAPAAVLAPAAVGGAFVDITGDTSPGGAPGAATGGESPLETTQVGLTNERGTHSGLDFDLGTAGDEVSEEMLDFTTAEPAGEEMIDLTASTDLDSALGDAADFGEIFDISAEEPTPLEDAGLDFTAPAAGEEPDPDMLDITKAGGPVLDTTGELFDTTGEFLDATTPGSDAMSPELAADEADTVPGGPLDFDISDTVAPPADAVPPVSVEDDAAAAGEGVDFDIGGFGLAVDEDTHQELEGGGLDLTLQSDEPLQVPPPALDFDLDDEAAVELDLSLTAPPPGLGDAPTAGAGDEDSESDIEFDLALQDTTDFENLAIDDTLELPKAGGEVDISDGGDESLEDLTRSMEASLAGFDLEDGETSTEESSLDLALEGLDGEAGELDFSLDDAADPNELDTLALDGNELGLDDEDDGVDRTVLLPRDDDVELQSDSDEADTKLNLAKAYIELGDNEGARSILDEVARDGSDAQQEEARRLLGQLA